MALEPVVFPQDLLGCNLELLLGNEKFRVNL